MAPKSRRPAIRGSKAVPKQKGGKKHWGGPAKAARVAGPEFDDDSDTESPEKALEPTSQPDKEPENLQEESVANEDGYVQDGESEDGDDEKEEMDIEEEVDEDEKGDTPSGFADAMARILSKSVSQKVPILAQDKSKDRELAKESEERRLQRERLAEKRKLAEKDRLGMDATNLNYEKQLRKLATRGVVRLFNAISKQQKEVEKKTTSVPAFKKDRVLSMTKDNFLELLKSGTATKAKNLPSTNSTARSIAPPVPTKSTDAKAASWNVFTDDYLMGSSSLKGWDRPDPESVNEE